MSKHVPPPLPAPPQHIVVVMLENRSYDNVLGWLQGNGNFTNPNPNDPSTPIPVQNQETQTIGGSGQIYPGTTIPMIDPGELFGDMAQQILGTGSVPTSKPWTGYPPTDPSSLMQGFTNNYNTQLGAGTNESLNNVQDVMNYLTAAQLPVTAFLAQNYGVCDAWFASVPSQTYVNRVFAFCAAPAIVSGDPDISVVNDADFPVGYVDLHPESSMVELPSICSQLDLVFGSGTNWKLYFHDYSIQAYLLPYVYAAGNSASNQNVSTFDNSDWNGQTPTQLGAVPTTFVDDVMQLNGGSLPMLAFIEPRYNATYDSLAPGPAPASLPPNCNHPGAVDFGVNETTDLSDPPIDATGGELLLMQVYNLLVNSSYWDSTLLIVTYDEHGGIFDHVPPPKAKSPGSVMIGTTPTPVPDAQSGASNDPAANGFDYTVLGGRVPAIIISPNIDAGTFVTDGDKLFDHTSIIKTAWDAFDLSQSPSTVTSLTDRDAAAASLLPSLTGSNPTGAFSGTVVASPGSVILQGSRLGGTPSQTLLASAGPGVTLTITTCCKSSPSPDVNWLTADSAAPTPYTNLTYVTVGVDNIHLDSPTGTYFGTIKIASATSSVEVPVTFYLT